MIKRIVEISEKPYYIHVKNRNLVLSAPRDCEHQDQFIASEDLGMLVVDNCRVSMTAAAVNNMMDSGAVIVFCNKSHLPHSLTLPFSTHKELQIRLAKQLIAKEPAKKRIWKQIIAAKIKAQARRVTCNPNAKKKLMTLADSVLSGDSTNNESQAARIYWQNWQKPPSDDDFSRDYDSIEGLNSMLNYGYAVIRAAVARAICCAGLMPQIGIFHHNRSNPYPLADDLMEPIRPLIDQIVDNLRLTGCDQVCKQSKTKLLASLYTEVEVKGMKGPLMVALPRYISSYCDCLEGRPYKLDVPVMIS